MLFGDEFLASLHDDPLAGTQQICRRIDALLEECSHESDWSQYVYDGLLEAYSLLVEMIDVQLIHVQAVIPTLEGIASKDCPLIMDFLRALDSSIRSQSSKLQEEKLRGKFRLVLGSAFAYEFSQGDLDKVQGLINELRDQLSNTDGLEDEHRQRLLRRLEKLQTELHKKVSDLDRFWGLIGDAGVVAGKLGKDAKPLVDRIREIAEIVWKTQSRSEELPSDAGFPLLEHHATQDVKE